MASDEAYGNFLDKANQDTGTNKPSARRTDSKPERIKAVDTDVPAILLQVEQYYASDADEAFQPVSLSWRGKNMPSEREFGDLIGHEGDVSTMGVKEFDPRGQYKQVLDAVNEAGDGKARVFKVQHGATRFEYYVVGLGHGKVVGMKALSVES